MRADGRTSSGRRVRDLYRCYLDGASNPNDAIRAQVLAAAELMVAAEAARAELLARRGDVEQIVRLENLKRRLALFADWASASTPRHRNCPLVNGLWPKFQTDHAVVAADAETRTGEPLAPNAEPSDRHG